MVLRATVDAGAGGTLVTSVTGTANQITVSPTTGAVIVGLASPTIQLGGADAAAPVAQSLITQNVVAGTSNTAGVSFTISGSQGTGTGAGGSLIFKTAPAGTTGTAQNALVTALTIQSDQTLLGTFDITAGRNLTSAGTGKIQFNSSGITTPSTSPVSGSWQFGGADVDTGPIAQTTRSQGTLAGGTSNVAGVNWTQIVSPGKGTGVGGSWILQTAPAGSTGTAVNATVSRITVDGPGNVVHGSAAIATNATDGFSYIATCAGTPTGTPTSFTGRVPMVFDTTNSQFWFYTSGAWKQPKTPAGAAIVTWQ